MRILITSGERAPLMSNPLWKFPHPISTSKKSLIRVRMFLFPKSDLKVHNLNHNPYLSISGSLDSVFQSVSALTVLICARTHLPHTHTPAPHTAPPRARALRAATLKRRHLFVFESAYVFLVFVSSSMLHVGIHNLSHTPTVQKRWHLTFVFSWSTRLDRVERLTAAAYLYAKCSHPRFTLLEIRDRSIKQARGFLMFCSSVVYRCFRCYSPLITPMQCVQSSILVCVCVFERFFIVEAILNCHNRRWD